MADNILVTDDTVSFDKMFQMAEVEIPLVKIKGNGKMTIGGKAVCLDGDEKEVKAENCPYKANGGTITGGFGTVEILMITPQHKAKKTTDSGKPVLLKGSTFYAKFTVKSPGLDATKQNAPDPMTLYIGTGKFEAANQKHTGT